MESDTSSTAAESVENVGFWVSFALIVGVSAVEALASMIWTRLRVKAVTTADGEGYFEMSVRVCGREIMSGVIDHATAQDVAAQAGYGMCAIYSHVHVHNLETVADAFGSTSMVTMIAIRRFNPATSLAGASGLVNNFMELFHEDDDEDEDGDVHYLENVVHLLVGLVDISLGITGLVRIPSAPQKLVDTLRDVTAPMTLENYLTLLTLWWILGVLLLVSMLPLRIKVRKIQWFGCPGVVASCIASMASLGLFGLGCWKIDYARRNGLDWTPMLSYWIGGASAIQVPCCACEISSTFGFAGMVFMLLDTF